MVLYHTFHEFSQAFIFLSAIPFQACGTQNWPNWDGKIEWTKYRKEDDRLRASLKEVIKKCDNVKKKLVKKGIKDFENHAEFRELDNEPFISTKLYPNLFPSISMASIP